MHLAGVLLLALPSSHRLGDRNHWQSAKQQREISGWADRLGVDKDTFQSFLWELSQHYLSVRNKVIRPFYVYADYTGSRQGWTMFANPRATSARFEIAVEIDGKWQLVFKPHSSKYDWNRWQFDHNRVRKLLGRVASNPHQGVYNELTRWLARQLAADFPRATRAKISMISWTLQKPEDVRAGLARDEGLAQYQEFNLQDLR